MKTREYDRVFLSPHLDDVALSCGGTMHHRANEGDRILVVSVFAGSPADDTNTAFTRELKERWGGLQDPVGARRQEDLDAMGYLGADALHLDFADCVYRLGADSGEALYPTVDHIFGDVHPEEALYHMDLARVLCSLLEAAKTVYVPLAAGHHVDHILTQRAALASAKQHDSLLFYEDYPYSEQPETIASALANAGDYTWHEEGVAVSRKDIMAKADAVACYRSQISTFWSSREAMRSALQQQALAADGTSYRETFWRITD